MSQIQNKEEVVIAYASRSLRLSQRRYCTTRREMLAAVVMCTHFRSYLRGSQFTLQTDHSSLRWLQKFKNEDGMLARWYLLLGQFSVTFEYRPGVGDNLVSDTASDKTLQTVRSWVDSGLAPPWRECAGLSPELRSWRLQVGNIKIDSEGRLWRRRSPPAVGSQLVIPVLKRREFIREYHDSLFAGHMGVTRTVYRLLDRVY